MDETAKDASGHRPSVSMPSLDSNDDFPAQGASSELPTDSFVSTPAQGSVEPFTNTSEGISENSVEEDTTQPSVEGSASEVLIEQGSSQGLDETESEGTLVESNASESQLDALIEGAPVVGLNEPQVDGLQQESLDDSQNEEDPSIAIDQFIKKIADEQLSSKRIEERKEEEAQEKEQISENLTLEDTESVAAEESTTLPNDQVALKEDNMQVDGAEPLDLAEENPVLQEAAKEKIVEPMEVDDDSQPTEKPFKETIKEEDHMPAESIEEIQKELAKNPPKKVVKAEESTKNAEPAENKKEVEKNNGIEHMEDESIEQILGSEIGQKKGEILKQVLEKKVKVPSIEDSAVVAKDPNLIEKAQEDIKKLDVLVCGECHTTFYYVQEFTDHKKGRCSKISSLSSACDAAGKPQVWGFNLWKTKHVMDLNNENVPSAWSIYQKWCKLPQTDRNAWITAGQTIQFASKVANAKVTEVKATKPIKQSNVQKFSDSSPPPLEYVDNNKENSSSDLDNSTGNIIKKGLTKPVKLNSDVTILPSPKTASTATTSAANSSGVDTNTAVRTTKVVSMKQDEFVVEKIMAKRFNPRKKTWEYNIKWENFGHDANTWEPISNLGHCKKLLEQFEEQLKRMKEEKAKQNTGAPKGRGRPANPKPVKPTASNYVPIAPKITIDNVVGGVSEDYGTAGNRPQRSSKQKAMNQVKQWCGSISDDDGSVGGVKRKHESDYSEDEFDEKKIKLEDDSDYSDSDTVKHKVAVKKIASASKQSATPIKSAAVKNGSTGQQVLPSNILIPDANGVVRINQKQLPSLSSGVYIMSKTAGIIKLDSTTSKVATSGGQTIVKVAPKIGQTQIKIVKKDGNTTKQVIQVSPKPTAGSITKFTPKFRSKEIRKVPLSEGPSKFIPKVGGQKKTDSDSDDGLEPLPFPDADEPLPNLEEEEKQEEFVLDPETGKIAGREYVDKPVVIKEEPQPVPPTTNELENMVKIAAADLSEDDLQNSDSQDDQLFIRKDPKPVIKVAQKPETSTTLVKKVVKYSVSGPATSQTPSILNRTLAQTHPKPIVPPTPKSVTPQPQRRVVQQKVINQMVSQRAPGHQARTVVRHVIEPSRQGGNINVIRKTVTSTPKPKYNLSPQKPLPSPLQPTKTYSAMGGIRQTGANKVHIYSNKANAPVVGQTVAGQAQGAVRRIGNTVVRSAAGSQPAQQRPQLQQTQKQPVARIIQRVASSPKKTVTQQVISSGVAPAKNASPLRPRTVINMPSLTEEDSPLTPKQPLKQPVQKAASSPVVIKQEEKAENQIAAETAGDQTDWSSFTMADGDNPIYVTGDDGTIYQVAGQNEQGQTILITQGPDGQQQCLLVTNEIAEMTDEPQQASTSAVTTETAETVTTAVVQEVEEQETHTAIAVDESLQTPLEIKTDITEMEEGMEDGVQDQVVAQVVRAEPPSPGGTHKVVVMLPDGNLMVTQVSPEEYASLELE